MEDFRTEMPLPKYAQTDEVRYELRHMAQKSTYYMGKAVIGFNDMTPQLHKQMCDWIDKPRAPGERRLHGIVPRDHLKSSVWTIAHTMKLIADNPNVRVLIANETATNAQHFLSKIDGIFRRNVLFQWLFPELIPDFGTTKRWNATEITVPRPNDYPEATIETIGAGGAAVSRHYNYIKLDDLVGKQASEESETMRKTIDWYQLCESLLEHPEEDWIINVGTPWGFADLDAWIRKHEIGVDIFERGCFGAAGASEGESIWPERFSTRALERLRAKYGTFKFSCQYLCRPRDPESGSFNLDNVRYYDWREGYIVPKAGLITSVIDPAKYPRYLRIDPAISEKPGAARSAIVVDMILPDGRVFVLDRWAKRCQPSEMIKAAFELNEQWRPECWGIEAVAYQRILKPIIEDECVRRGTWVHIVDLKPDQKTRKENRIRGALEPYISKGLLWVHPSMDDLLTELQEFPTGSTVDIIDALAYGPQMWQSEIEQEDSVEERDDFYWDKNRSEITGY